MNKAYPSSLTGRRFLSKEGKGYKEIIAWAAHSDNNDNTTLPISISYTFGFADRRRRDVDDYIKLTQDALTGVWFKDDCQIVEIHARKVHGDEEFVEIIAKTL